MAIIDFASLSAALSDWDERTWSADKSAEFIGLAEGEFRLYFGPNYAKEATVTLSFAAGVAPLPAGFVRATSLVHANKGEVKLISRAALDAHNPHGAAGLPDFAAISGTSITTAPLFSGDLSFTYEGTLTGLAAGNPSNWLIANAPQAYLLMCKAFAKLYLEDFGAAAALRASALQTLNDLGIQAMTGQFSATRLTLRGATP